MNYKAILFDIDNTLLDFTASEISGLHAIHAHYFKNIQLADFQEHYHSINKNLWRLVEQGEYSTEQVKTERFKLLAAKLHVTINFTEVAEAYEHCLAESVNWYPNAKETLLFLQKNFQLGVITNGLAHVQEKKYYRLGFDQLCSCYIVSGAVGVAKPNKAIFDLALAKLELSAEQVLMVGDSLSSDYQGALNANIDFCWVNQHATDLPTALPTPKFTVKNVQQLTQLV